MTRFQPVSLNQDIDIHSDPVGLWARVIVIGGWTDAKVTRKNWPHAAAVGPLRTVKGIDLLVRNLLANPQIRVVVWDGPCLVDQWSGRTADDALFDLWTTPRAWRMEVEMEVELCDVILEAVVRDAMFDANLRHTVRLLALDEWDASGQGEAGNLALHVHDSDRVGGAIVLPPPAPVAEVPAPHGDPGERVAADTLAELWPRVLHRIMSFGREIRGGKDMTRELLNLVTVVRDPAEIVRWLEGSPAAEGIAHPAQVQHPVLGFTVASVLDYSKQLQDGAVPPGALYSYGSRMRGNAMEWLMMAAIAQGHGRSEAALMALVPDQIAGIERLLNEKPDSRAAFATPWRPAEDSGKESGRPCLVGVTFRATPTGGTAPAPMLHMTVIFRSHDMFAGYTLNMASAAWWLVDLADRLGMHVGTLTCMSQSAHVYDRDWNGANKVIAAMKHPAIRWDQRSSWRIEAVDTDMGKQHLRATAIEPGEHGTGRVIAVFEAPTKGSLLLKIERSGLVTEIGAALWIGAEIERTTQWEDA